MKIALTTFNSKYIHPSVALRILKQDALNHGVEVDMFEYTIKEDLNRVVNDLKEYDIVGISCYIYNIELTKKLIEQLRLENKNIKIILGGPEVSYITLDEAIKLDADYVICGEGESVLSELLSSLNTGSIFKHEAIIDVKQEIENTQVNIVSLDYAQPLMNQYDDLDIEHQIIYLETSRGCPYLCSYCQASLDNLIRPVDLNEVLKLIEDAIEKEVKLVKFLDRTFNFDVERTNKIISHIIELDNNKTTFQFEITGELLDESSIRLINKKARPGLFRFEIGVQSTNYEANKAIRRFQNFDKLKKNILSLKNGGKIVIHLDLIAGLPYENLDSFVKTFNDVYNLEPLELQLGFLKLLKGTHLNTMVDQFEYQFDKLAPYQIKSSAFLSESDLKVIEGCEHGLEHVYNARKAKEVALYLISKYDYNPFYFYESIGANIFFNMQLHELYELINDLFIKDSEDKIELLKNYYAITKQRPKVLFKCENKKAVLHHLIAQENLVQNEVFSNSNVEHIKDDVYFVYLINTKKHYLLNIER
ncbi:MAG: DUF4080 domain-containing protein [Erysipelotrichales bacterium]